MGSSGARLGAPSFGIDGCENGAAGPAAAAGMGSSGVGLGAPSFGIDGCEGGAAETAAAAATGSFVNETGAASDGERKEPPVYGLAEPGP